MEREQAPTSPAYDPPSIEHLGTLAELTQGGSLGPDDGLGGAGSAGSI